MSSTDGFCPPSRPPPLLTIAQTVSLAQQGYLPLQLSAELQSTYLSVFQSFASSVLTRSADEKLSLYPQSEFIEEGYYQIDGEKEYVTYRSAVRPDTELEHLVRSLWHDTAALLHRVLVDLAYALDLPQLERTWDTLLDGCLDLPAQAAEITPTLLRLFQYLPQSGIAERHTDLGFLTLCVGSGPGLQVTRQVRGGQIWEDVLSPTLLVGDALHELSGRRVRAGLHRVVGNAEGRHSIVFALRPSLRHQIDMALFGYEGHEDAKEFWDRVKNRKHNVNAPKEVREKQKEALLAQKEVSLTR